MEFLINFYLENPEYAEILSEIFNNFLYIDIEIGKYNFHHILQDNQKFRDQLDDDIVIHNKRTLKEFYEKLFKN